jgi:hypothetical protein
MPIDAGIAGIVGAVIGGGVTLGGIWLTHHLQHGRSLSLAEKRRARLRQMLSGEKFKWRSLSVLAASIGADEATTAELLIEIDARASIANNQSWALVSRAPWPEDMQPER